MRQESHDQSNTHQSGVWDSDIYDANLIVNGPHWPSCTCNSCNLVRAGDQIADELVAIAKKNHPTLLEIAERQAEIDKWEAENTPPTMAERAFVGTIAFASAFAISAVCGWAVEQSVVTVLFVSGVIAALATGVTMLTLPFFWKEAHAAHRPEPLDLKLFSDRENRALLLVQAEEPFRARCACPGCGDVDVHSMRDPRKGEPQWPEVIRRCATCNREWAQR